MPVSGLSAGVQAIAVGGSHSCALINGGVQCWGSNSQAQIGITSPVGSYFSTPTPVPGMSSAVQFLAAGYDYNCSTAAANPSGVDCWGNDSYLTLGSNSDYNVMSGGGTSTFGPSAVSATMTGLQAIAAGADHACALINGWVQCWGSNQYGQLAYFGLDGNGASESSVPVQAQGLSSGVQSIAAGGEHSCAVVGNTIRCWGLNNHGQIGTSITGSYYPGPTQVQVQW